MLVLWPENHEVDASLSTHGNITNLRIFAIADDSVDRSHDRSPEWSLQAFRDSGWKLDQSMYYEVTKPRPKQASSKGNKTRKTRHLLTNLADAGIDRQAGASLASQGYLKS